jgi:hypothetical protein
MTHIQVGEILEQRELVTIRSERVSIPHPTDLVHLQFRRFAGCPICNLHLRSFTQRHQELARAGIREVVVFHSPVAEMLPYQGDLPFAAIADPANYLRGRVFPACSAVCECLARCDSWRHHPRPSEAKSETKSGTGSRTACRLLDRSRWARPGLQVWRSRHRPVVSGRGALSCILIAQRHKPVVVARTQAEVELAALSIKEGVA